MIHRTFYRRENQIDARANSYRTRNKQFFFFTSESLISSISSMSDTI